MAIQIPINAPASSIWICRNTPADISYKFVSDVFNATVAKSYAKYSIGQMTPIRNNQVRVPYIADDLMDCDYLVFNNNVRDFGCFITNVRYVNPNCSIITLELDVWGTYYSQLTFNPCMVLREHVLDDTIATNFEPEPLPPIVYKQTLVNQIVPTNMQYLLLASADSGVLSEVPTNILNSINEWFNKITTVDENGNVINVNYDNVKYMPDNSVNSYPINGQTFVGFLMLTADYSQIAAKVQEYGKNGTSDRIIGIFQVYNSSAGVAQTTESGGTRNSSIDGYTPKNNKCLQYPFQRSIAVSSNGNKNEYSFDLFSNAGAVFTIAWDVSLNDTVVLAPVNYNSSGTRWEMGLVNSCRGEIPFSVNGVFGTIGYKQIAQAILGTTVSVLSSAPSTVSIPTISYPPSNVISMQTGEPLPPQIGSTDINVPNLSPVANLATGIGFHILFDAPQQVGHSEGNLMSRVQGGWLFRLYREECRYDIVQSADNYFSRYGYAINKIKVPNITGHANFNFVQTKDCEISGNIPANAKEKLQSIFDSGVTIFHSLENFGKILL